MEVVRVDLEQQNMHSYSCDQNNNSLYLEVERGSNILSK